MHFKVIPATGFLKNYVKHYCFMESGPNCKNVTERVIPIENVQIMFHYKNPFLVYGSKNSTTIQPRSLVSGLGNSYFDVSTSGETGVIFVSFHPAGACHFFPFPLCEIENQSIDLSDIYKNEIMQVEEKLFLNNSIPEKIKLVEDFLLQKFLTIPLHDALLIQRGFENIKRNKGQITAIALSNQLSVSGKSLERKFSQYLGKTTKQIIKLVRFQEIVKDLSNTANPVLTDCAYRNGYFDQSHFIRDFKTFTGLTPGEFYARYSTHSASQDFNQA